MTERKFEWPDEQKRKTLLHSMERIAAIVRNEHGLIREDESDLKEIRALLSQPAPEPPSVSVAESWRRLAAVLREILDSGVEFDDERLKYKVMQVHRADIEEAEAALLAADGIKVEGESR